MISFIEFGTFLQLVNVGVAIAMLYVFIKMYSSKNREHEKLHQEYIKNIIELVTEVTKALNDKNHTDEEMSNTLKELTEMINDKLTKKGRYS